MCPTFQRSVRPPFATTERLQELAVVSLAGLTCRRNCEFEVLKMTVAKYDLVVIGSGPVGLKSLCENSFWPQLIERGNSLYIIYCGTTLQ
jgi:hypothetical protein